MQKRQGVGQGLTRDCTRSAQGGRVLLAVVACGVLNFWRGRAGGEALVRPGQAVRRSVPASQVRTFPVGYGGFQEGRAVLGRFLYGAQYGGPSGGCREVSGWLQGENQLSAIFLFGVLVLGYSSGDGAAPVQARQRHPGGAFGTKVARPGP